MEQVTIPASGFVRDFEPLRLLTEGEVERIHQGALDVLEVTGVRVDSERALKIYENGALSAPIPSFAVLAGSAKNFVQVPIAFCPQSDKDLNEAYSKWLQGQGNFAKMDAWLQGKAKAGEAPINPSDLGYNCDLEPLLRQARAQFKF